MITSEELRQKLAEAKAEPNEEESLPEGKCGDILVKIDGKWRWVTPVRYDEFDSEQLNVGSKAALEVGLEVAELLRKRPELIEIFRAACQTWKYKISQESENKEQ